MSKKTTTLSPGLFLLRFHWGQSWGRMAWVLNKRKTGKVKVFVWLWVRCIGSFYFYWFVSVFFQFPPILISSSLWCFHSGVASWFQGKFTGKKFAWVRLLACSCCGRSGHVDCADQYFSEIQKMNQPSWVSAYQSFVHWDKNIFIKRFIDLKMYCVFILITFNNSNSIFMYLYFYMYTFDKFWLL